MRTSRIYYAGELRSNQLITLPQDTSHYLSHVLRLKPGAQISIFNGESDGQYTATLESVGKKNSNVLVGDFEALNNESPLRLHLLQGIARGEKMDWIIQKAVELGVSAITPLLTEFTTVNLKEDRAQKRMAHWQKIIISACEQSGRTQLPLLNSISTFSSAVKTTYSGLKIFCDPEAKQVISSLQRNDEILILIGPEGGFAPRELELAIEHQFQGICLGPRVLRTETASVAAITLAQGHYGDLNTCEL